MSDKGVAMSRKLVFMAIVIMMVVPFFASTTRTNPSGFDGVIVVFRHGGSLTNNDRQTLDSISRDNTAFLRYAKGTLSNICPEIIFKQEIDTVMCAVSVDVPVDSVSRIARLPFVQSVNGISSLEPAGTTENADLINATPLYSLQDEKSQSITGTGIVVGVIDSGIDYRHPDLGAGKYGELGKVIGGTNFLSKNDPPIDDDNLGHGTAIAGLISCDSKTKYPGVAPNSRLRSYKVYNNIKQKVAEDLVVSALNQAVKDGCQVVNISLSSPGTGDKSALSQAAESATNSGVVVVGAAGDFGCQNTSTTGAPVGGSGVGQKSICVGSSDMRAGFAFTVAGKNTVVYGMAPTPYIDFGDLNLEIVDGGYGTLDELASLTLRGKYILLKRGPETGESISYVQKVLNAKRRGATGVLIWNNQPGELYKMDLGFNKETGESLSDKDLAPSAFISYSDGLYLSGLIKAAATQIKPSKTTITGIARFSAMGPTDNLTFKPDFCAPGLGLSTTMSMNPTSLNVPKYTNTFSGTSASAALVSGAAALIKQYRPTWSADDIRLALMNTSTVIMNQNSKQPSSFLIQGAGQINVAAAANTPAVISPGGIIFTTNTKEVVLNIKGMDSADLQISTKVFDGLDEKIKLTTSATAKSVSKGRDSTLIVNAEFDPDALDMNAQGIVYLESQMVKLHIPVVFWKEFSGASSRPIKTASYNSNMFDYTKPDKKVTFQFTIANGDKFEHKPMKYTVGKASSEDEAAKYNNLTNLDIDLVDGNGDTWVTIKRFENLEIGYYKFDWEGLDSEMLSKVPNGTYQIKLVQFETVGVKGSTNKTVSETSLALKGSIKVIGSDIPQPPQLFMVCKPVTPSENQMFVVDVYITNAKDVGLVSGEIVYPADEVTVLEAKAKDFLGNDGSAFESDLYIEPRLDEKGKPIGKIVFKQKRSSDTGASGWGLIASFIAKCDKSGNPEVTFRNQSLYDSKGNWIQHMASPLILEITTEEPLVGDLNFDGMVDMTDIFVFSQSFGLTRADKNFNILADFNNDGIVDGKDYDILRKNLGKRN